MPSRSFWGGIAVVLMTAAFASGATQTVFHVAPDGSDGNPGTKSSPFASLERARQAVRSVNRDMNDDIVVLLRGGTYPIDRTVALEAEDSGFHGHTVIYRAEEGETPVVSGGRPVIGWQPDEKGRWKAPSPVENFRQLYVGGVRGVRARGDLPAELEPDGEDGYIIAAVQMADWRNPDDLEICYRVMWCHTHCKVQSIRRDGDYALLKMLQPHFSNAKAKEGVNILSPDEGYLENAVELLDEPGEWYLDRKSKTVYYMPRDGEDMSKVEVIAPAIEKLVELRGTLDRPVHDVRFKGITFAHGTWLLPSEIGLVDMQANFVLDWQNPLQRSTGLTNVHNEHNKCPANVVCHAAKTIAFERCTFTHLGGAGLNVEFGSQDNAIIGCRFHDISGSAVQIGDVLKDDHHPDDPRKIVKNNSVVNNYIHDCGVDYWGGVGIFVGYTDGTHIAHNVITAMPSSAISMGWGWGEEDAGGGVPDYEQPYSYDTPTPAKNNRVEWNAIHDVMNQLGSPAAICTLGSQPGTLIRGNYIHDCNAPIRNRDAEYLQTGIFLDEGSAFIHVCWNLVTNVPNPAAYNNHGQERLATCVEHDNFLGDNPPEAKAIAENAGLEPGYQDLLPREEE